jgi:hypothetical protein
MSPFSAGSSYGVSCTLFFQGPQNPSLKVSLHNKDDELGIYSEAFLLNPKKLEPVKLHLFAGYFQAFS